MGKSVIFSNHKGIKRELGIEIHRGGVFLVPGAVLLQFLVAVDHQFDLSGEEFLHGVLNILSAIGLDKITAELGGRVDGEGVFLQIHDLSIVKPGRDHHRGQLLLHMT